MLVRLVSKVQIQALQARRCLSNAVVTWLVWCGRVSGWPGCRNVAARRARKCSCSAAAIQSRRSWLVPQLAR